MPARLRARQCQSCSRRCSYRNRVSFFLISALDKPNSVVRVRWPPTDSLSPGLLGETCSLYSFHLCPSRRNIRPREVRVVDEVQIHVFDAKLYNSSRSSCVIQKKHRRQFPSSTVEVRGRGLAHIPSSGYYEWTFRCPDH
jgi:hypothetical protein